MSEEQETEGRQDEGRAKAGLEILYAKPGPKDGVGDVAERDLAGELRERYWIRQAEDAGIGSRTWSTLGFSMPWRIERHEIGRNRNEPGDGFWYVFRGGIDGTEGRAEWFEVTEVFEGVEAKGVEAFMRINNGGEAGFDFDPGTFVRGLDMGTPFRAAQRRAADKVIAAVEKKMNKASYEGMWRTHGYGTLIVGLPLWFATYAADPLRVENVIDDFWTRVQIGLEPHARRLKKKTCPFWRIVVVWNVSLESMREWGRKARLGVYDDPAYRRMRDLPVRAGSIPLLLELMSEHVVVRQDGTGVGGASLYIFAARPEKKGKETSLQLPPAVEKWKQQLDDYGKQDRKELLTRVKWRAMQRGLEVLCFLRVYGLAGLDRWAITRLSPRRRIARLAMRWRALGLYRASRRRKTVKGAADGRGGSGGRSRGGARVLADTDPLVSVAASPRRRA